MTRLPASRRGRLTSGRASPASTTRSNTTSSSSLRVGAAARTTRSNRADPRRLPSRLRVATSCRRLTRCWASARRMALRSSLSLTPAARSTSVRAGVVTRIPLCRITSRASRCDERGFPGDASRPLDPPTPRGAAHPSRRTSIARRRRSRPSRQGRESSSPPPETSPPSTVADVPPHRPPDRCDAAIPSSPGGAPDRTTTRTREARPARAHSTRSPPDQQHEHPPPLEDRFVRP